jgi:hypothetical protein
MTHDACGVTGRILLLTLCPHAAPITAKAISSAAGDLGTTQPTGPGVRTRRSGYVGR